jgi:hypothetical protein
MKQALAILLMSTLVFPSCAARAPMRAAAVNAGTMRPQAVSSPEVWQQFARQLPIGSLVRVRTSDRRTVKGILLAVDDDALTVNARTRIPEPPQRIAFNRIAAIEPARDDAGQLAKAVAIGAGVGGATFLGLLMLLAASWD